MSETTNWVERSLVEADALIEDIGLPASSQGMRKAIAVAWLQGHNAGSLETLRTVQDGINAAAQPLVSRMGAV